MSFIRYKKNPFLDDMLVPVKGKQVRLSQLGRVQDILISQNTGQSYGTHVTTFKRVDGEQFIKLFTANIAMTFDLSAAGIKAFSVLLWSVQNKALAKDEVDLDSYALEDFIEVHKNRYNEQPLRLSMATFKRGINELEKAQIVAKTMRQGRYFINPNFLFNGDRVAFTTLIERKRRESKDSTTLDLFKD